MKSFSAIILSIVAVSSFNLWGTPAHGQTAVSQDLTPYRTIRFNNENWHTLPHPKVASFSVRDDGSMFGLTENGISFVQYTVPNTYGIRVQRFEIEDYHHYVVNGEIAETFTELSQLLAVAYNSTSV